MNEGLKYYYWLDIDGCIYDAGWHQSFCDADAYVASLEGHESVWIFDSVAAKQWVFVLTHGGVSL